MVKMNLPQVETEECSNDVYVFSKDDSNMVFAFQIKGDVILINFSNLY